MRYLPNQYINPALTIRDREKKVASSNLNQPGESAPYTLFKRDLSTDDPEDYRGKPAFGVEEDGQGFFVFPFVQAPNKKNTNKDMKIATTPPTGGGYATTNGGIVDLMGRVFYNDNGVMRYDGTYDEAIHGEILPGIGLDQANKSMKINRDVALFPRISTGEPMTNMEKKQGLDVLRKTKDPKQIKRFVEQMMKGV